MNMNSGMIQMLKSLGFDPDKIVAEANNVKLMVQSIDTRLSTIERDNAACLAILEGMKNDISGPRPTPVNGKDPDVHGPG